MQQPPSPSTVPWGIKKILTIVMVTTSIIAGAEWLARQDSSAEHFLAKWKSEHGNKTYPMVIVGNSIAYVNIDINRVRSSLNLDILEVTAGGSGSAWWYLALKNLVAERLETQPTWVLIPFRDLDLTSIDTPAGYRETDILRISQENDSVLHQKLWKQKKKAEILFFFQNFALFRQKEMWKRSLYEKSKTLTAALLGMQISDLGNHISNTFNIGKEVGSLTTNQRDKNFQRALETSFLPDILNLAHEHNWRLILVRQRTRASANQTSAKPGTEKYINALKNYADQRNVLLLDYNQMKNLTSDDFRDNSHLNEGGKQKFTTTLIEDLRRVLYKE